MFCGFAGCAAALCWLCCCALLADTRPMQDAVPRRIRTLWVAFRPCALSSWNCSWHCSSLGRCECHFGRGAASTAASSLEFLPLLDMARSDMPPGHGKPLLLRSCPHAAVLRYVLPLGAGKSLLPCCFLGELRRTVYSKLIGRITFVPGRQQIKNVHLVQIGAWKLAIQH